MTSTNGYFLPGSKLGGYVTMPFGSHWSLFQVTTSDLPSATDFAHSLKCVSWRGVLVGESITYSSDGCALRVAVNAMTGAFAATAMS